MDPINPLLLFIVVFGLPAALVIGALLLLGVAVAGIADSASNGLVRPGPV